METENTVFNNGCEREVIKEVGENFPDSSPSIFTQALIVKAVDLRNLAGLVVSAENMDAIGIADLEYDEERHSLDAIVASVNIIAHKKVIRVRGGTANPKELQNIVPLIDCTVTVRVSEPGERIECDGSDNFVKKGEKLGTKSLAGKKCLSTYLAMNIATDGAGTTDRLHIALADEDGPRSFS